MGGGTLVGVVVGVPTIGSVRLAGLAEPKLPEESVSGFGLLSVRSGFCSLFTGHCEPALPFYVSCGVEARAIPKCLKVE